MSKVRYVSIRPALKSKEPRLRDWNLGVDPGIANTGLAAWNQKNLDYEIETCSRTTPYRSHRATWNQKNLDYEIETLFSTPVAMLWFRLEIKRTSITRLKRSNQGWRSSDNRDLKSKEPRLRDWNLAVGKERRHDCDFVTWNQKNLDYEIETLFPHLLEQVCMSLEIKRTSITRLKPTNSEVLNAPDVYLEIKRTSITRLKRKWFKRVGMLVIICLKSKEPRLRDWNIGDGIYGEETLDPWNQKNLDYEIEIESGRYCHVPTGSNLKSKEPRLRDWNLPMSFWNHFAVVAWNQKNLDYEIEIVPTRNIQHLLETWNQKNLDYEIEIRRKRKNPIKLRNSWNQKNLDYEIEILRTGCSPKFSSYLKSKEPRLRDWNVPRPFRIRQRLIILEIKRTSITRLK